LSNKIYYVKDLYKSEFKVYDAVSTSLINDPNKGSVRNTFIENEAELLTGLSQNFGISIKHNYTYEKYSVIAANSAQISFPARFRSKVTIGFQWKF